MLVNFFGKRGTGKTTAINGQLDYCVGPVVVLDILGNFNDPAYIQVDKTDEAIKLIKHYVISENKKELNKIIVLKTFDPDLSVDYISAALWEANGGTLILDECDGFNISNAPCFDWLIRYGRNRNIDLITGCRRPAELSRNITAGANKLFIFQTQEPRDIEYFEKTILGPRSEKLMDMAKFSGQYVDYDNAVTGEFRIDIDGNIYILTSESL
jgi:hypothetical protein